MVVSGEFGEESPDGEVITLAIGLPVDAFWLRKYAGPSHVPAVFLGLAGVSLTRLP